jgi:predicted MFS family arabinose efflux permease
MQVRNLTILIFCQLISTSATIVMVMLGGIIGSQLATNQALATLPLSLMVVSTALTTIPASMLMSRIGRRNSFSIGSLIAVVSMILAVLALRERSFLLYNVAALVFGINMAFTQQYRYAAAESVEARYVPRAISLVLVGSIGAAFLGTELVMWSQFWSQDVTYGGTMALLIAMFLVQASIFQTMAPAKIHGASAAQEQPRSLREIICQPIFIVAVLGATTGFGLMTLIMTATPLSMHVNDQYSIEQTASIIRVHVLGMYLPSLATGFLIEKLGVTRLMFAGALGLLAAVLVGLQGHALLHYWWALLLLGIGWNFLYVGGTTMLTYTYRTSERFRVQGFNDFLVFGSSATASLLAGTVMFYFGWGKLMLVPLPFILLICVALMIVRKNPALKR